MLGSTFDIMDDTVEKDIIKLTAENNEIVVNVKLKKKIISTARIATDAKIKVMHKDICHM